MRSKELKDRAQLLRDQSFYDLFELMVENSQILKEITPTKRRPWLSHVVEEIYDNQGGKCAICGCDLEYGRHEVDHIIPHCYGGGNERSNLQLACLKCNREKRNLADPTDLLNYLEDRVMNL